MAILQDVLHCEEHCLEKTRPGQWVCGVKKHYPHHTQGCYFGVMDLPGFEISEEDFNVLPDPDDMDTSEFCYTMDEIEAIFFSEDEE